MADHIRNQPLRQSMAQGDFVKSSGGGHDGDLRVAVSPFCLLQAIKRAAACGRSPISLIRGGIHPCTESITPNRCEMNQTEIESLLSKLRQHALAKEPEPLGNHQLNAHWSLVL